MIDTITLPTPNDFHVHLRQGPVLDWMVKMLIDNGYRGKNLLMPNTLPDAVLTGEDSQEYEMEALNGLSKACSHEELKGMDLKDFGFIMTIQITEQTTPEMIASAWNLGVRHAKVYPKDVTTNSENGVSDYIKIYPALREAQRLGMFVHFHGEHPSYDVQGKDKVHRFLEEYLQPILIEFRDLFIVLEHISTMREVQFIQFWRDNKRKIAGTVAPQYLVLTQDDVIGYSQASHCKGQVHHLCKPMLKWREDRDAIQDAVIVGDPGFFFATDTAPHLESAKYGLETSCGILSTPVAIPIVISFFEKKGVLDPAKIGYFISHAGADCFGIPRNEGTVTFVRKKWTVPKIYRVPGAIKHLEYSGVTVLHTEGVVPMGAGQEQEWQIVR